MLGIISFRLLGLISVSIIVLSVVLVPCSRLVMTSVLSKLNGVRVAPICCASDDARSFLDYFKQFFSYIDRVGWTDVGLVAVPDGIS